MAPDYLDVRTQEHNAFRIASNPLSAATINVIAYIVSTARNRAWPSTTR